MRWLVLLLIACSSKKEPPPAPTPAPAPAAADAAVASALAVGADKRVELMSIVMRLARANEYVVAATPYARAVDNAFAAFASHPAVRMAAQLRRERGISHDAPMLFAVHLDEHLQLVNAEELAAIDKRWQGVDAPAFAALVRQFATDANLDAFFAAQRPEYAAAEARLRALANPVPFFEELFGKRGRHVVVPGMLLGTNNVGVRNGTDFYQVLSEPTQALLVHEMAHSYINPAFARHAAELEPAGTALYPLFAATMRAQNYADWRTMFDESGVRALTVLYLRTHEGDIAGAAAARAEMRAGFVWINELVEVFRKYQRDRARYADFDAYVPQIAAFFDGLVKQYGGKPPSTPFLGPFDAVLRGDYVLALAPGPVAEYAKRLPFFATKPVVAPTATIEPGKGIVAYGTPATNAVIDQLTGMAGWKLAPDFIELGDRKIIGEHLVLIATWFRRDDPTKGVAVYAAANEADLIGINNLRHGPHDWLVAKKTPKGYDVLETGDWPLENGAWVPPRIK